MTICMKTKDLKQWPQAEQQIKDIAISKILETGAKSTEGTYTGRLRKGLSHESPKRGSEIQDAKLQPEFKGNPDCNFEEENYKLSVTLSQAPQKLLTMIPCWNSKFSPRFREHQKSSPSYRMGVKVRPSIKGEQGKCLPGPLGWSAKHLKHRIKSPQLRKPRHTENFLQDQFGGSLGIFLLHSCSLKPKTT